MFRRKKFRLRLRSRTLVLCERTLVMGVLNVTPGSAHAGGSILRVEPVEQPSARASHIALRITCRQLPNNLDALVLRHCEKS